MSANDLPLREISRRVQELLSNAQPLSLSGRITIIRQFTQPDKKSITTEHAKQSFSALQDYLGSFRGSDKDALVSLIIVTLVIPCYHFYSKHESLSLLFFQLFSQLLADSSRFTNPDYRFSIAVIISRSKIYSETDFMNIDKWSIDKWLGDALSIDSSTNMTKFRSKKLFPFSGDSQAMKIFSDNSKYPLDLAQQYASFIEKARIKSSDNDHELQCLQGILNHLCDQEFILKAFLNDDHCLSSMLIFAIERRRICAIKITDINDIEAQTKLTKITDQILNQVEYNTLCRQ